MKKKVIRIGTIGLGSIATKRHLPGNDASPNLIQTALCDTDVDKLRAAQDRYGVDDAHCFTDFRDLINCPDVDAIDICTPNDLHYQMALAAIESGKPYALEKPITLTAEEADVLANRTQERSVKNMVCFSYRFKAAARFARDLVANGAIGELYHANMRYFQGWGLPKYEQPLVWRYQKEHAGSGALGDLGCHAIDLVRFVTGRECQ
ncbi:Gfo/Idh/MocA family oxidoreductase, partial [Ruminococcaceae bacterium OttesenSCG-928-L11]|nr:Gfo/Idh/MocA family oxidoreductase [Ruminococcaceae bacterium OttesenSCG-928-L11]